MRFICYSLAEFLPYAVILHDFFACGFRSLQVYIVLIKADTGRGAIAGLCVATAVIIAEGTIAGCTMQSRPLYDPEMRRVKS